MLHYVESFSWANNFCIVMEYLGKSLYDFLIDNNFIGYPIKYV